VAEPRRTWAFVTSHGAVLVEVSRTPEATVRELAERAGLTERQAHRILADLAAEGYIIRERVGRRNRYRVNEDARMRHQSLASHRIGELLAVLAER
jgi:DNA-binding MarR family transcriptional regulator